MPRNSTKHPYTMLPRRVYDLIPSLPRAQERVRHLPYTGLLLQALRRTVGTVNTQTTDEAKADRERSAAMRIRTLAEDIGCSPKSVERLLWDMTTKRYHRQPPPLRGPWERYGRHGQLANAYGLAPYYLAKTDVSRKVGGSVIFHYDESPQDSTVKVSDYYVGGYRPIPNTFIDLWLPLLSEYEIRLCVALLWIIEPYRRDKDTGKLSCRPTRSRYVTDDALAEATGIPTGPWRTNGHERLLFADYSEPLPGRFASDMPYRRTLRHLIQIGAVQEVKTTRGHDIIRYQYSVAPLFEPPPAGLSTRPRDPSTPRPRDPSGSPRDPTPRPRAPTKRTGTGHSYKDHRDTSLDTLRGSRDASLRDASSRKRGCSKKARSGQAHQRNGTNKLPRITQAEAKAFLRSGWWKRNRLALVPHSVANWDVIPCPWCGSLGPSKDEYPCVVSDEGAGKCHSCGHTFHLVQLVAHVEALPHDDGWPETDSRGRPRPRSPRFGDAKPIPLAAAIRIIRRELEAVSS